MNKILTLLAKRAERAYLAARIVLERRDLLDKPFLVQVRTYTLEAIDDHVKALEEFDASNPIAKRPELPDLVYQALEVEATESIGYYRGQYLLFKKLHEESSFRETMAIADHSLALAETIETRQVLKEALDQLTAVKFSADRQN